jgi:hypothetical protein
MKRVVLLMVTLAVLAVTAGMAMAECGVDHGKTADSGTTKTGS